MTKRLSLVLLVSIITMNFTFASEESSNCNVVVKGPELCYGTSLKRAKRVATRILNRKGYYLVSESEDATYELDLYERCYEMAEDYRGPMIYGFEATLSAVDAEEGESSITEVGDVDSLVTASIAALRKTLRKLPTCSSLEF